MQWFRRWAVVLFVLSLQVAPVPWSVQLEDVAAKDYEVEEKLLPSDLPSYRPFVQAAPDTWDSWVIWEEERNHELEEWELYAYDFSTGVTHQLTEMNGMSREARVAGGFVVWKDDLQFLQDGGDFEIMYQRLDQGQINASERLMRRLTDNEVDDSQPDLEGNFVVWARAANLPDTFESIWAYDLELDREFKVYEAASESENLDRPRLWRGRVYFIRTVGGEGSLLVADVQEGAAATHLIDDVGTFSVQGGHIAYTLFVDTIKQVWYMDNDGSDREKVFSFENHCHRPSVYGDWIAFHCTESAIEEDNEVALHRIGTEDYWLLSDNPSDSSNAEVGSDYVVFMDDRGGDWDIYYTKVPTIEEEDNLLEVLLVFTALVVIVAGFYLYMRPHFGAAPAGAAAGTEGEEPEEVEKEKKRTEAEEKKEREREEEKEKKREKLLRKKQEIRMRGKL
jgi:hypothetical protein